MQVPHKSQSGPGKRIKSILELPLDLTLPTTDARYGLASAASASSASSSAAAAAAAAGASLVSSLHSLLA